MKMTNKAKDDAALEALFDSARKDSPDIAPDYLARLAADADAAISRQNVSPETTSTGAGLWSKIIAALVPASGLAAATLAGVWIGFQVPSSGLTDSFAFADDADFDVSAFLPVVALSGFSDLEVDG